MAGQGKQWELSSEGVLEVSDHESNNNAVTS
jgi:hypothetical protein